MRRMVVLFLAFSLLCGASFADHENIPRISSKTMFTAEAVAPAGTATSGTMQSVAAGINQSVQATSSAPSGTINMALVALCSADGTTFAQPTVGGTITTITEAGTVYAPISIPMCKEFKLKLVNLSSDATTTVTAIVISQ